MIFITILALIVLWNITPLLMVAVLPSEEMPWVHKRKAMVCFLDAAWRGLIGLPADLLAPIVVPLALLFTKREDNYLPKMFVWWDNDKSINGDREEYWPLDYHGSTYYSKYEPRSFMSRWIWLGFRNRASRLSVMLGKKVTADMSRENFGDPSTERNKSGWCVRRCGNVYELYVVKQLFGSKIESRSKYGFKVGAITTPHDDQCMVVCITISFLSFTG